MTSSSSGSRRRRSVTALGLDGVGGPERGPYNRPITAEAQSTCWASWPCHPFTGFLSLHLPLSSRELMLSSVFFLSLLLFLNYLLSRVSSSSLVKKLGVKSALLHCCVFAASPLTAETVWASSEACRRKYWVKMGRMFLVELEGWSYRCKSCKTHLALADVLVSRVDL